MNSNSKLLNLAKQVQALSEIGQHYAESDYDMDRYNELNEILLIQEKIDGRWSMPGGWSRV